MRVLSTVWACALGAALLGSCAPNTQVVSSWKSPDAQSIKFQKIIAVYMSRDVGARRAVEDELVRRIPRSVASYTLIPNAEELEDTARAHARVSEAGFDGAVIMHLVSVDKETTVVPGSSYAVPAPYGSMWGGWGYGWSVAYDPGYVQQDRVVSMVSNVYHVPDGKLVWASRSKTYNPSSITDLVNQVVDATLSEMKKQKAVNGG